MKTILGATKRYFLQELVETQNGAKKKRELILDFYSSGGQKLKMTSNK